MSVISSGMESRAWINDYGEVIRAETPLGLTLETLSPQEALAPVGDATAAAGEFLTLTSIRPAGETPFRGAQEMVFRVTGQPQQGLPTDRVQMRGEQDELFTIRPQAPSDAAAAEPGESLSPEELEQFLRSDPFIQANLAPIREQAQTIVAELPEDAWVRARAIGSWVYQALDKQAVLSIPSALEVLEQRRGDCNEHTVLYTALARAVEIPTRIAIGIVWSETFQGFYYHAWPEVWLGHEWVWLDPTLGQDVADATRIKLFNGGIETWPQLLPYLGRLEIEVLEIN